MWTVLKPLSVWRTKFTLTLAKLIKLFAIPSFILTLISCAAFDNLKEEFKPINITNAALLPVGVWQAQLPTSTYLGKSSSKNQKITLNIHIHENGAAWGVVYDKGNLRCSGEFKESKLSSYSLRAMELCLNLEGWQYNQTSKNKIIAKTQNGKTVTFLKKQALKLPKLKKLHGEWENSEYDVVIQFHEDSRVTLIQDGDAMSAQLMSDEGGLYFIASHWGDVAFLPIHSISRNELTLYEYDNETAVFVKNSTNLKTQLIKDDYGRSMELNSVSVDVLVRGAIAQTTVDISFTNKNANTEEAQFALPLPSNATVIGYALDVEGQMIPGVAIPKAEAEDIFETQQNRGIDPGLAKVSEANQFTTEVYPIEFGQTRRIQVTYIEPLNSTKNKINEYAFPIHQFGEMQAFNLSINTDSKIEPNFNTLKIKKQKSTPTVWQQSASGYTFNVKSLDAIYTKPIVLQQPKEKLTVSLYQFENNAIHFLLQGQTPIDKKQDALKTIHVAWDTSLSMHPFHDQYVALLKTIRKTHKSSDVLIYPFNIQMEPTIEVKSDVSHARLKTILNQLIYDGASNISTINNVNQQNQPFLLFSDGMHSYINDVNVYASLKATAVYPGSTPVNLPLLRFLSNEAGTYQLEKNNFKKVAQAINQDAGAIRFLNQELEHRISHTNSSFSITGKLAEKSEILSLEVNGEHFSLDLKSVPITKTKLGEYLWANQLLAPLLASPRIHKTQIEHLGLSYGLSTPYTTLIVLEDFDDYVEFGVEPPSIIGDVKKYQKERTKLIEYQKNEAEERSQQLVTAWQQRMHWWKTGEPPRNRYFSYSLPAGGVSCEEDNEECLNVVEEVFVMGIRESLLPNVILEPWNPNTPYMKKIRAAAPSEYWDIYTTEREHHLTAMPFYMDMAKFYFDQGQSDLGIRILSNILEQFPGKPRMERLVAYLLKQYGQQELATKIFEHLNEIAPYQASSKRDLAIIYEERGLAEKNAELVEAALRLYYEAATQSKDNPFELPVTAIMEMNNLINKAQQMQLNTSWINPELRGAMDLDLRITLSWTNEFSMVDLYVTEPGGEVVEWKDRVSKMGAWLPYDSWGNGPVEYLLKEAKPGEYSTKAVYWADDGVEGFSPIGVRVDFYLNYGRENEQHITSVVRLELVDEEILVGKVIIPEPISKGR